MVNRVTRIALDVDGTLAGYGGIIDKWTIDEFLKTAHVGIVSTRADCHRVASELGLGYACCAGVDKPSKADCLRDYAQKYPVNGGSIYIADMPYDFQQAMDAGWNFADVNHLRLNLGAGGDIHRGFINIDARLLLGIDIVRDLEKDPIPFPNGTIQFIKMQDFLEHLSWRRVASFVSQVYAKLKLNGWVFIQSPDVDAIYHGVVEKRDFHGDFKYRFEAIRKIILLCIADGANQYDKIIDCVREKRPSKYDDVYSIVLNALRTLCLNEILICDGTGYYINPAYQAMIQGFTKA